MPARTDPRPGPGTSDGRSSVTASLSEMFALAGLPVAIRPEPAKGGRRKQTAQDWDRRIGALVHQVVGRLVRLAREATGIVIGDLATEIAADVVQDRSLGNLTKARGRVAGMASLYCQRLAPPASTLFLGAEVRAVAGGVDGGVDLAWAHPAAGVFYDELKSWQQVLAVMDGETTDQVHRYLDAGLADHGDRFAGVRVLTLSAVPRSLFVDRLGTVHALTGSPVDPAVLKAGAAARGAA